MFADSLILGSASEFVSQVNGPCDNIVNEGNKIANTNLLYVADGPCEKPADILFGETVSNLRNCSVTDKTDKAINRCAENASALTRSSGEVKRDTDKSEKANTPDNQYYKYEEVSSQELPVFVNNLKQSVAVFDEEMCSSDIPLCLKF